MFVTAATRKALSRLLPYACISKTSIHLKCFHTTALSRSGATKMSQSVPDGRENPRVAVLYQAIDPPTINGVRKPMKPGGYQDSGADIAYSLKINSVADILTPHSQPDPRDQTQWCFPDTEEGILGALEDGATHLWANTILFATHPIQMSPRIGKYAGHVKVLGQPPLMVELFDDKEYVNNALRAKGSFTMPLSWSLENSPDVLSVLKNANLPYPIVGKPVRGRGSQGVKVCNSESELLEHINALFKDSPAIMLEEYLAGEEVTVTVMPPSPENQEYWALPVVTRFNHIGGIAPYNGVVAVTANSRVITDDKAHANPHYHDLSRECEQVAKFLHVTAPIRIDARRFRNGPESKFALFDINMKPNMTGPGRPGREDQASLTLLAAAAVGWDYSKLLKHMLDSSLILNHLRKLKPGLD